MSLKMFPAAISINSHFTLFDHTFTPITWERIVKQQTILLENDSRLIHNAYKDI